MKNILLICTSILSTFLLTAHSWANDQRTTPQTVSKPPLTQGKAAIEIPYNIVTWLRAPQIRLSEKEIDGQERKVIVHIDSDGTGIITDVKIVKSSGSPEIDHKIVTAVRRARLSTYKENDVIVPYYVRLPVIIEVYKPLENNL